MSINLYKLCKIEILSGNNSKSTPTLNFTILLKMTATDEKSILINNIDKISGIMGVQDIIKSFAFYDTNSLSFQKKIHYKKNRLIIDDIQNACSRKNGFTMDNIMQDEADSEISYWIFMVHRNVSLNNSRSINRVELQLEAVNCPVCGEYKSSRRRDWGGNIPACYCGHEPDYDSEYDDEIDYGYESP